MVTGVGFTTVSFGSDEPRAPEDHSGAQVGRQPKRLFPVRSGRKVRGLLGFVGNVRLLDDTAGQ